MWICKCKIEGIAPISYSKPIASKKKTGESHEDFEGRTWPERIHSDEKGNAFIPPMALKNSLAGAAKYLSETVPGKGKATYTKHFMAGTMVVDPIYFTPDIKAKSIEAERLFLPSDGRAGGGTRVWKSYPFVPAGWVAEASIYVSDDMLATNMEVQPGSGDKVLCGKVWQYLEYAGQFIGLLRFRPRNGGFYGRFVVKEFEAQRLDATAAA